MYGHRQNTNVSWADAAHLVFHLHTYHTYLQGWNNKKSLSLLPPVIEQRTPYATTQLRSSTCSTLVIENKCCENKNKNKKFEFELVLYLYRCGRLLHTIEFIVGPAGPLRV
jgi:hypothetical protein